MEKNGENFLLTPLTPCDIIRVSKRGSVQMNPLLVPLEATWDNPVPASVVIARLNALVEAYGDLDVRIAVRNDYSEVVLFGEIEVLE